MIGHMVLQRNVDSEDVLGLKVRGGQVLPNDEKGAIIEQVQRGSIADQEGHIRPGKYQPFLFRTFEPTCQCLAWMIVSPTIVIGSKKKDIPVRCRVPLVSFYRTILYCSCVSLRGCFAHQFNNASIQFFISIHTFSGDEVVEWNGHSLRGKSALDVCDIIDASKLEPLVEILVTREISINRKNTQASWRKSHSPTRVQTQHRGGTSK